MNKNFNFFSIGVYDSTEEEFFKKLIQNRIDTFIDVRRRRGVRGAKYSFVNSKRLQAKLETLHIRYEHIIDLSPTNELRELQKEEDFKKKILKKDRTHLGEKFKNEYKRQILDNFNFANLFNHLDEIGAKNIVFFCVEKNHLACHRSLITDTLEKIYFFNIKHL
jgi:uncharacterized protein (DUF488 family)